MMDFMDTLKRGVDRAGFELDRFLRANRVRSQLGGLKSQADEEMRQIGERVFEQFQRGDSIHQDLRPYCERIAQLRTDIAQRESELEAINRESAPQGPAEPFEAEPGEPGSCPGCGATAPEGATFCPRCGANLKAGPEMPPPPPERPAP